MWIGSWHSLWYAAVKALVLFVAAVAFFRLSERRTLAQLAPFDVVALVAVGAVVGRTATAADTPLMTGVVVLGAVLLAHRVVSRLRYVTAFRFLVDHQPRLLVVDGEVKEPEMRRTGLTHADLDAELRRQGVDRLADVHYLVYEGKGNFSVVRRGQIVDGRPLASVLPTAEGEPREVDRPAPPEG